MCSDKKKWSKTEKDRKNMEKENNTDRSDFSENEIPGWNYLKPFEFEPKTNIGDIISSSSDDEDEGVEYKVKRVSNKECANAVQKQSLADVLQNRCQTCSMKFPKSLWIAVFAKHLYSDG